MEKAPNIQESVELQHEKVITHVISFVTSKIEQAVEIYAKNKEEGDTTDVVEYLQKIWTENDGVPWRRKPRFAVPDLEESIFVRFESETTEYDISSRTMSLAVGPLRKASTPEEFDIALMRLMQSVYHESEHIYNSGQEADFEEGAKGVVEYLCNEGEIAAFARQYSFRYKKEFPDQPFDLDLMQQLAVRLNEEESDHNIYSYFVLFPNPERQEKYKEYGNVLKAYNQIVESMKKFLE